MSETLHSRFMDANIMVDQTDAYYLDITGNINWEICQIWEEEIKVAEVTCCQDIKAMDIYAAQLPDHLQNEQSSGLALALALVMVIQTLLKHWIEFGLLIEESQSVVFLH